MSSSIVSELSFAVSIVKETPEQRVGIAFLSDEASSTIGKSCRYNNFLFLSLYNHASFCKAETPEAKRAHPSNHY